jgi:hypothetical protein
LSTLLLQQAPLDALRLALDPSSIHPIDVALVNGEVFMNLATAGPVSEVSSKGMSDTMKKLLGPAAVAVAGKKAAFVAPQNDAEGCGCERGQQQGHERHTEETAGASSSGSGR